MNDTLVAALVAFAISFSSQCTAPWETAEPFAPQPDTSEGLVNVSADLLAVLEDGTLRGACASHDAARAEGRATRALRLKCGKELFFYGDFDMPGVPQELFQYFADHYPEVGEGYAGLGMIADPTHPDRLPLGMVPSIELAPGIPSLAFGCASCHLGQLPDGRYAVGAPNHDYDYGKQLAVNVLFPFEALGFPGERDPEAVAWLAPLLERFAADPAEPVRLISLVLPLAGIPGGGVPTGTPENQRAWVSWKPGTQDFLMAPAPDDGIHTISKISPLWAIPDTDETAAAGMPHAMLGWTGVSTDVAQFIEAFVAVFNGESGVWTPERLAPLADYVSSLRAPQNPAPPPADAVARGAALFANAGCQSCHYGPRGSGVRFFDYETVGTDPAMKYWMDSDFSGDDPELTYALKAPRLVGLWAQRRFLHNGSLDSLEELFCLEGDRPRLGLDAQPYSDAGHDYTCSPSLSAAERMDLIAYLETL